MKMTSLKKVLSFIACIVLIAAMALISIGCNGNTNPTQEGPPPSSQASTNGTVLGEGASKFTLTVTDAQGKETSYQISTDKKTVGDALLELNLISGEEGPYGLYVKTVNGITLDYNTHGKYWAFYVNGQYALSGIDTTEIIEGSSYAFKAE